MLRAATSRPRHSPGQFFWQICAHVRLLGRPVARRFLNQDTLEPVAPAHSGRATTFSRKILMVNANSIVNDLLTQAPAVSRGRKLVKKKFEQ